MEFKPQLRQELFYFAVSSGCTALNSGLPLKSVLIADT